MNTASIAGLSGDGDPLIYSAAKSAVISMTRSSAVELAPHLIRVNAFALDLYDTAGGSADRTDAIKSALRGHSLGPKRGW